MEHNDEDPKSKVGDHVKVSNIKIFLQEAMSQFGANKCLWFKKSKILSRGHMLLVILMVKTLLEHFYGNELKKEN